MAGHSGLPFSGNAGTVGVTVFFVLSGFLITRLLVEEHARRGRVDLRAFYARRARRLLPAAGVFLVAAAAAHHVAGTSWWPVLSSATYLANVATLLGVDMHLLQHLWSLSMEEQFYLLWPALLGGLLAARRRWLVPLLLSGVLTCTVWRVWLSADGFPASRIMFGPDTRADALVIGALLALLLPHATHWRWGALALGGSVVLVGCIPLGRQGVWTLLPVALAAAAAVGWAAQLGPGQEDRLVVRALDTGPLAGLGRISYGVYLWHFPIAIILAARLNSVTTAALTLALSTGIAALSWRYVEQPFLRRRYAARSR